MDTRPSQLLADYLLAMGDDELILGHRDSEWCGHAPILEEDIAFANLALDEIGHASIWYGLSAQLSGQDPDAYPDQLVYRRKAHEFRNARLVELPNGDWAFSMLRQFLFDAYERIHLEALASSTYRPLAEAAGKIRTEEHYHYRHTRAWIRRLGLGTEESHARLQNALDQLWSHVVQLFSPDPEEQALTGAEVLPPAVKLWSDWSGLVLPFLRECRLSLPTGEANEGLSPPQGVPGRAQHTPHLRVLVAELQSVARLDPEATW